MFRNLIIIFLLLFSLPSFAVEFYWKYSSGVNRLGTNEYPSPKAWCDEAVSRATSYEYHTLEITSETTAICSIKRKNYSLGATNLIRYGDSCSENSIYDPLIGECSLSEEPEEPEQSICQVNSGQTIPFDKSGTSPDSFLTITADGKFYATDQTACFSGCLASVYDTRCKTNSDKTYFCKGTMITLAQDCGTLGAPDPSTAPPVIAETDDPTPPVPVKKEVQEPCVYIARSDGSLACRSTTETSMEGMSCGLGPEGQTVCSASSPSLKGRTIDTTVTTTTNPDGTSTVVKEDVSTYVTCVGVKCDTKTTTSTTTTGKAADGSTTSSTSVCIGPDCKGNSSEGGTAESECTVDCTEEEGDFTVAELSEVAGFGESVGDFTDRISASPIMTSISGIGLSGGGSCSFPSASTAYFNVDMNIICENSNWLQPLYYIMLAFWAFAAVRVFLSA